MKLPIRTKPPKGKEQFTGDNISPEMSRWLADVAQGCDFMERAALAQATQDIAMKGSAEDPIKSIYDSRVPKEARDFILDKAARVGR
jgi:hypothetical protein